MSTYSGHGIVASGAMSILACRPEILCLLSLIIAQTNLHSTPRWGERMRDQLVCW